MPPVAFLLWSSVSFFFFFLLVLSPATMGLFASSTSPLLTASCRVGGRVVEVEKGVLVLVAA